MKFIFWIIYYLKCGFNLLFSQLFDKNRTITHPTQITNKTQLGTNIHIIKLQGSYYEMGQQYGSSMKNILIKETDDVYTFIKENEQFFLRKAKKIIINDMDDIDIIQACDILYERIKKFIPQNVHDYFKGVSDGSTVNLKKLIHINLIPELMDNHCILFSKKTTNGLLSIRTLDYSSKDYNQVITIFNPTHGNKYISLNISFNLGIVTGINNKGIIATERYCDYFLGWDDHKGVPFHLMFHTLLQKSNSLDQAHDILQNTNRMGNLHISISDYINSQARVYNYTQSKLEINMELTSTNDKAYSVSPKEKRLFEKYKNDFNTAEELIKNILPIIKSGEIHVMIYYDYNIYVSVTTKILQSYNNTFYKLSLEKFFG